MSKTYKVRKRVSGDWAVYRVATDATCAVSPHRTVAVALCKRWNARH